MSADAAAWLKARKACTLWTAFQDMRDYIESYVDAANDMATDRDKRFPFQIERGSGIKQRLVLRGFPFGTSGSEDTVVVEIVLNNHNITVSYPKAHPDRDLRDMVITQKWNARTEKCMLWLNGEEWTNRQISQMALDPLFFA